MEIGSFGIVLLFLIAGRWWCGFAIVCDDGWCLSARCLAIARRVDGNITFPLHSVSLRSPANAKIKNH